MIDGPKLTNELFLLVVKVLIVFSAENLIFGKMLQNWLVFLAITLTNKWNAFNNTHNEIWL